MDEIAAVIAGNPEMTRADATEAYANRYMTLRDTMVSY
jgi:hypothetical protein